MDRKNAHTGTRNLREIAAGGRATVTGFTLPEGNTRRLLEMGFTPGTELEVIRFAPLGDPIEVRVRGYHLSMRRVDAAGLLVAEVDSQ